MCSLTAILTCSYADLSISELGGGCVLFPHRGSTSNYGFEELTPHFNLICYGAKQVSFASFNFNLAPFRLKLYSHFTGV